MNKNPKIPVSEVRIQGSEIITFCTGKFEELIRRIDLGSSHIAADENRKQSMTTHVPPRPAQGHRTAPGLLVFCANIKQSVDEALDEFLRRQRG